MLPFIASPEADLDSDNFFIYIAQDNLQKAGEFLDCLEETFNLISRFPEIATKYPKSQLNIRWFPVKNFPNHLIFYREEKDHISILRIFHKSRDIESIL